MSIKAIQRRERIRRIFNERTIEFMKYSIAGLLTIALLFTGCSTLKRDDQAQAVANMRAEVAALNEATAIRESKHGDSLAEIERLKSTLRDRERSIKDLEQTIITLEVAEPEPEIRREPENRQSVDLTAPVFVRDKENFPRLPDQLLNPGALLIGERTIRFGATGQYEGHAIFPDVSLGLAALIDLIIAHEGATIEAFIGGGDGVEPELSYSGGVESESEIDYRLRIIEAQGLKRTTEIHQEATFLLKLVRGIAHNEGWTSFISDVDFRESLAIRG